MEHKESTTTGSLGIGHTLPSKPRMRDFIRQAKKMFPKLSDPELIKMSLVLRKKHRNGK